MESVCRPERRKENIMPYVDISLARGKSPEYLRAVSAAVHQALVQELGMLPGDKFQLIHQFEPDEMIYNRDFRGGPRSDDFIVFRITDGIDRGEPAKRKFYRTLVTLLQADPGVDPQDVFVMMYVTPAENFSFAGGVAGTETVATEALDRAARVPGARDSYTKQELIDAVTELFKGNDRRRFVAMLNESFILKVPESLPYGGTLTGPNEFDAFFQRLFDDYYDSFITHLDHVLDAGDHLIAPITITARGKTSDASMVAENVWVIQLQDGNFASAQIYADTAAGIRTAG
jgi:hypothetical protein